MVHQNKQNHERVRKPRRRLHRDWRAWVVVALMLAAMLAYVISDNESLQFGGGPPQQPVPAATGL
jgi:hypothetical protein